jgi:hypothetical protein
MASLAVKDIIAETLVSIDSFPSHSWPQGAGVAVRVQGGAIKDNPPAMYVCYISPDDKVLGLVKCPGGNTYDCGYAKKKIAVTIKTKTPYKLRMSVKGSTLSCALPDSGHSFQYTDASYPTGGVALVTFRVVASFSYLKVMAN